METGENYPQIPGYRVNSKLGHGGMANVYLGVQEALDRQVAIKILNPAMAQNSQILQRFLNEARTASRLQHPNIITIHDVGQTAQTCYIVMEYLRESLLNRIKFSPTGKLEPKEALHIAKQLAHALQFAHKEGIIHRDIKPDNILFRKDNTPVLVDFGIARALDTDLHLTTAGMIIGTPHYMSPEQCRGEKIDGQSDIYSLGIVLFEMLTGQIPYRADSAAAILVMHIQAPIPKLPPYLAKFQGLIDRMMAKEKSHRIHSCDELLKILREYLPDSQLDTIEISKPDPWSFKSSNEKKTHHTLEPTLLTPTPIPRKRKRPGWKWIAAAAFLVLAILGIYNFLYIPYLKKNNSSSPQSGTISVDERDIVPKKDIAAPASLPITQIPQEKSNGTGTETATGTGKETETKNQPVLPEKTREEIELEKAKLQKEEIEKKEKSGAETDDKSYREAVSRNTAASYEKYLQTFPKGRHFQEAQKRMENLQNSVQLESKIKEDVAFETSAAANTIDSYNDYLKQYPKGTHADEAKSRIEILKQKIAREMIVQFEIKEVKFFESGATAVPLENREYKNRFPRETTRYIFAEINYINQLNGIADARNKITLEFKDSSGSFKQALSGTLAAPIDIDDGIYWRGLGWTTPGKWMPGTYTVSLAIENKEVFKAQFEVF